jgi:hypothetical protein
MADILVCDVAHNIPVSSTSERGMHTNLKGRIFSKAGVSWLVLDREDESPDWLWVKSINAQRQVCRMHREDILRHIPLGWDVVQHPPGPQAS